MPQWRTPMAGVLLLLMSLSVVPSLARRAVSEKKVSEAEVAVRVEMESKSANEFREDDLPSVKVMGSHQRSAGASGDHTTAEQRAPTTHRRSSEGDGKDGSSGVGSSRIEGPIPESVVDRGLVSRETSAASILQEHLRWHEDERTKRFEGETLGYVTPWHGRGYDLARRFRSKLSYVSPVWYQLKGQEVVGVDSMGTEGKTSKSFMLTGGHDFDEAWISDVRDGVSAENASSGMESGGSTTKIVPRVVLEMPGRYQLSRSDLFHMSTLLVEESMSKGYHGYVLDIPISSGIEEFLASIKLVAQQMGTDLLLIQSVRPGRTLSDDQVQRLAPLVHRFSLMTYDYGSPGSRGGGVPNSPSEWIRKCVEALAPRRLGTELRRKILMGLPFYGYDNGQAVGYEEALAMLQASVSGSTALRIQWDMSFGEHVISYTSQDGLLLHRATYPTLQFIQERVELARELGVGMAVWELGQGMPYFFDLL